MSCRRATHVTFPIPSTKPARTILKFSPDFRAETSVNKHVNSEMNPPHTHAAKWQRLFVLRSILGLKLGFHGAKPPELWHSRELQRAKWQRAYGEGRRHDRFISVGDILCSVTLPLASFPPHSQARLYGLHSLVAVVTKTSTRLLPKYERRSLNFSMSF